MPYSFQSSYHKFKEICKLDPEIYQVNGGKLDEEYYNKVLKYFDMSLDNMSKIKTLRIVMIKSTFHIGLKNGLEIESFLIFLFGLKMKKLRKTILRKLAFMFGGIK